MMVVLRWHHREKGGDLTTTIGGGALLGVPPLQSREEGTIGAPPPPPLFKVSAKERGWIGVVSTTSFATFTSMASGQRGGYPLASRRRSPPWFGSSEGGGGRRRAPLQDHKGVDMSFPLPNGDDNDWHKEIKVNSSKTCMGFKDVYNDGARMGPRGQISFNWELYWRDAPILKDGGRASGDLIAVTAAIGGLIAVATNIGGGAPLGSPTPIRWRRGPHRRPSFSILSLDHGEGQYWGGFHHPFHPTLTSPTAYQKGYDPLASRWMSPSACESSGGWWWSVTRRGVQTPLMSPRRECKLPPTKLTGQGSVDLGQ
ncbi:hypothetical protein Sjap_020242 [Stephania japonica]|uniref:Uncharacterized protein n=1 Tax=Stephania japonica TaxID=461633 RepID=A0AAP0HVF3_9MAGN